MKSLPSPLRQDLIRWRRDLHQRPELSFQEERTSRYVFNILHALGGLEVTRPTTTSVMARLQGAHPGPTLALRADMDALPITEETGLDFASKTPGVMHACGHDGHTAILLATAKQLLEMRDHLHGEVRFLFQHAEELYPGGAEEMVQAGVMHDVDRVLGLHLWTPLEVGRIGIAYGPMMAAPDKFWLTVHGSGGHVSSAPASIDAIYIAAQIAVQLQHIVARNTDPHESLILYVTQFNSGVHNNIIPEAAELAGTVRSYSQPVREAVPQRMEQIVRGLTEAHGAAFDLRYEFGYRPLINEESSTRLIEQTAVELYGAEAVVRLQPSMAGEDFSAFLQKAPGSFFFVGAGNTKKGIVHPHHHPRFDIDENALEIGVRMFVHAARKFLS
ncbi:MAG: amidohydrolase [Tumebacillaceae bacterium]